MQAIFGVDTGNLFELTPGGVGLRRGCGAGRLLGVGGGGFGREGGGVRDICCFFGC